MRKMNLQKIMPDVIRTYKDLLAREMRGPSDSEGAMHRLQAKFGLDYWTQWALRYRSPRRIAHDVVLLVEAAHLRMIEQSVRRDLVYLKTEIARGGADADVGSLVAQAESLLAKIATKKGVK